MKGWELFKALEEGKLLVKDYHSMYPLQYEKDECKQYFFHHILDGFVLQGWGSHYTVTKRTDVLIEIATYPERWTISEYEVKDQPWKNYTIKA